MIKWQKIATVVTMSVMMAFLAPVLAPQVQAAAEDDIQKFEGVTPINAGEFGIEYGQYTGLSTQDVRITASRIIRTAMGLLGLVATVIVLIGGFTWMTAGGDDEKVATAKKWIFSGIIGLVIVFSAYGLSRFVLTQLSDASNPDSVTVVN